MSTNLNNLEMSTIAMYSKEGGETLGDKAAVALYYFSELVKHCSPTIHCYRETGKPSAAENSIAWVFGDQFEQKTCDKHSYTLDALIRHFIHQGNLTFSSKVHEDVSVPVLSVDDVVLLEFHLGYPNEHHHWSGWKFAAGLNSMVFVKYDGWSNRDKNYLNAGLIPNLTDGELVAKVNLIRNAHNYINLQRLPVRTEQLLSRFYDCYRDKHPLPTGLLTLPGIMDRRTNPVPDLLAYLAHFTLHGTPDEQVSAAENYNYIRRVALGRSTASAIMPQEVQLHPAKVCEGTLRSNYLRKVRYNKVTGEKLDHYTYAGAANELEVCEEYVVLPLKCFQRETQIMFERELV